MPNVVFIISDDQAWGDYGFMGHEKIETPSLDQLAAESLTFLRGYTPVPLCRPSLATMITGIYPHQHGVVGNDPALPDAGVNAQASRGIAQFRPYYEGVIESFAKRDNIVRDLVGNHGYVALQTGKWWEGDPVAVGGFTQAMTKGIPDKGGRHGDAGLRIGRDGLAPVVEFMDGALAAEKPFFLWYAPFLPHAPHTPPADLLEKYQALTPSVPVAKYWAMCEFFDRTCGELLGLLETRGIAGDTVVVYACDNGWVQDPEKPNRYAPRSKRTPYENGVRTPLMVRWPGKIAPEVDATTLASTIDIVPTLRDLLGLEPSPELPGLSWRDRESLAAREAVFGESYAHDIADISEPSKSLNERWVVTKDGWKLIAPYRGTPPELYRILDDPGETADVAAENPAVVARLVEMLDAWWNPGDASR